MNAFIHFLKENITPKRFDYCIIIALISFFILFVSTGIHGFSIGCWDMYVPQPTESYSYPHIGCNGRAIRSDEWIVSTPQVFAQYASKEFFPRVNRNINGGTDMFMSTPCNPVWDWTVLGQFHNWGYFLFDIQHGLAWNWWCRYLGILLFSYFFFLTWLNGNRILAFTASLAVTFAPPTQWWTTTIPYILLYFFSTLFSIKIIFLSKGKIIYEILGAVTFTISLTSFAFAGYPIWSLLLIPALIILGHHVVKKSYESQERQTYVLRRQIFFVLIASSIVLVEILYYLKTYAPTIGIISNSTYPGARFSLGGSLSAICQHMKLDILSLFSTFSTFKLSPELQSIYGNQCEASRFFVPGVALTVVIIYSWRKLHCFKINDVLLFLYGIALLAWSTFSFPAWFAKLTGFYIFKAGRVEVIMGFIFMLLTFRIFSIRNEELLFKTFKHEIAIITAIMSCMLLIFGLILPEGGNSFFVSLSGIPFLFLGCFIVATISYGFIANAKYIFCIGWLFICVIGGLTVNPISRGVSPIKDKELAQMIKEIDQNEPGIWISNHWVTGNFIMAQGVECYAGTQQYMHEDFWKTLDPTENNKVAWNRYGHRNFTITTDQTSNIEVVISDTLQITLNKNNFKDLNISYLVWTGQKRNEPWLELKGKSDNHFIYKVNH